MTKTREQTIFDELYIKALETGEKVFDYRPMEDVGYPFIEFEETVTNHKINKCDIKGTISITISIWGLYTERRKVSELASYMFNCALSVYKLGNYHFNLITNNSTIRMMDDNTTVQPLKRAIVELNFNIL